MIHPHHQTSTQTGATLARQREIQARCFHPTGAFIEFTKEAAQGSIPARFEQQARRHPHRLAFKSRSRELTYDQLNQAANRLAWANLERQGPGQQPVALLVEQDAAMVVGILGIWKAGKVYVALDPAFPQSRNSYILEDSQARLVVTNRRNLGLAKELAQGGCTVLDCDELASSLSTQNPSLPLAADRFSYVLYTSGSTGQPKGVIQSHGSLLWDVMQRTNSLHLCPEDRLTLLRAGTGAAVKGMLQGLLNGASLHSLNLKEEGAAHLFQWLKQEGITFAMLGAPLFRNLADTLTGGEEFPDLRLVQLGSDAASRRDVERFQQCFPTGCVFINTLSSTESGCMTQYYIDHQTELSGSHVPVGYPLGDTEVLLLDEDGQEVGFDQTGEIVVRSRAIGVGYWRRPDLTQDKFRPDPQRGDRRLFFTGDLGLRLPDGCLVHRGRKDFQVRIRGNRVETSEIELALRSLDNVKDAAVIGREDQPGRKTLAAYLVPATKPGPSVSALRRALAQKLPSYMVPAAFVTLEALPLLPNGKINRLALPAPDRTRPELAAPFIAPRTPEEEQLAKIWAQVLGLEQVGVDDDFLELGGDSLLATQVISRVIKAFNVDLPLRTLFSVPTVAQMTVVVAQHQAQQASPEDVERLLAELEALSEEQASQLLASKVAGPHQGRPSPKAGKLGAG
ncbi:MAG TPA: non-ribosomal peptide synthetase [Dehalococcoidia bacterium]|nr:non-ribosomal peptide synthetase [Dehalococcoidia bacterium]